MDLIKVVYVTASYGQFNQYLGERQYLFTKVDILSRAATFIHEWRRRRSECASPEARGRCRTCRRGHNPNPG